MLPHRLVLNILEKALHHYIHLDPQTRVRLRHCAGKVIALDITGWRVIYLEIVDDTLKLHAHCTQTPDTILRGEFLALFGTLRKDKPTFSKQIIIEGDIELGQALKQVFVDLHIDWEDYLARYCGDVIAHQLCRYWHIGTRWGRQAATDWRQNISEYLQEEARYCPPREELEDFFQQVSVLRDDVERLQARVQHLLREAND